MAAVGVDRDFHADSQRHRSKSAAAAIDLSYNESGELLSTASQGMTHQYTQLLKVFTMLCQGNLSWPHSYHTHL